MWPVREDKIYLIKPKISLKCTYFDLDKHKLYWFSTDTELQDGE